MKQFVVVVMLGAFSALVFFFWLRYRAWAERQRAADERFAGFIDQVRPAAAPAAPVVAPVPPDPTVAQQKLLLEAASKAGEAGEAVLSIQLYARLLARYPQTAFGTQARAAVEAQKKKLVKP
jgi:type II secretory pathway pseudopilin PulG